MRYIYKKRKKKKFSRQATFLKLRTKRLGTLENENVAYIWTHFINFSIKYLSFWQLSTLNAMVLPTLPKTPTLFQSGSSKLPNGHFTLWSPTSLFRDQSFTSLMANSCQDTLIFFIYLAGALIKHSLEGIAPLRNWYVHRSK